MKIEVYPDAGMVARRAAEIIATDALASIASQGRFILAGSGGRTQWLMLRALATEQIPWENTHVVQVDERVAPIGDPDRNFAHLRESLLDHAPLPPNHVHTMTVEAPDLDRAAQQYAEALMRLRDRDPSIPAFGVRHDRALLLADRRAAAQLDMGENLETQR